MRSLIERYREIIKHKQFYLQLATGLLLIVASFIFNHYANSYTASYAGQSVNDIILDHIPTLSVEDIFLEGALVVIAIVIALGLHKPARIPYMLKAAAVFICVRSFFIILTHLAPPVHESIINSSNFFERLVAGSDDALFFSGHTGFPFLAALGFWNEKPLRYLFLSFSIFFAGVVLVGHLHYSIDVFSAFFISYGISHIAMKLFKKDYATFLKA